MGIELVGATVPIGLILGLALAVLIVWLLLNLWDRQKTIHLITHFYRCRCACSSQSDEVAEISADGTNGLTASERQKFSDRLILTDLDVRKHAEGARWCSIDQEQLILPLCGYSSNQLRAYRTIDAHDIAFASYFDGQLYNNHADAIVDATVAYLDSVVQADSSSSSKTGKSALPAKLLRGEVRDQLRDCLRQQADTIKAKCVEECNRKVAERADSLRLRNNRKVGRLMGQMKERQKKLLDSIGSFRDADREELKSLFEVESQNEVDTLKFRLWLKQVSCFESVRKECLLRHQTELKSAVIACITELLQADDSDRDTMRKGDELEERDRLVRHPDANANQTEQIEPFLDSVQQHVFDVVQSRFEASSSQCRALVEERSDWFAVELLKLSESATIDGELLSAHVKLLTSLVEKLRDDNDLREEDCSTLLENLRREQSEAMASFKKREFEAYRSADASFQLRKRAKIEEMMSKMKVGFELSSGGYLSSDDLRVDGKAIGDRKAGESAKSSVQKLVESRTQTIDKQNVALLDALRELDAEAMREITQIDEQLMRDQVESLKKQKLSLISRVTSEPFAVKSDVVDSIARRQEQQLGTLQQMLDRRKDQVAALLKEKKSVAHQMRINYQKQDELERGLLVRHERLIAEKLIFTQITLSKNDRERIDDEIALRVAGIRCGITPRRVNLKIRLAKALESHKRRLTTLILAKQAQQLESLRNRSVLVSNSKSGNEVDAEATLLIQQAIVRIDIQQNLGVSQVNRSIAQIDGSSDERERERERNNRNRDRRRDFRDYDRDKERDKEREREAAELTQTFIHTLDRESERTHIEMLRDAAQSVKRDEDAVGVFLASLQVSKARQIGQIDLQNELLGVLRIVLLEDFVQRGLIRDGDTDQLFRQFKFDYESVLSEIEKQIASQQRAFKKETERRVEKRKLAAKTMLLHRTSNEVQATTGRYAALLKKMVLEHRNRLDFERSCSLIDKEAAQNVSDFEKQLDLKRKVAYIEAMATFLRNLFSKLAGKRRDDAASQSASDACSLVYEVMRYEFVNLRNEQLLALVTSFQNSIKEPAKKETSDRSVAEQLLDFDCAKSLLTPKLRGLLTESISLLFSRPEDASRPIDVLVRDERYTPRSRDYLRSVTFKDDVELRQMESMSSRDRFAGKSRSALDEDEDDDGRGLSSNSRLGSASYGLDTDRYGDNRRSATSLMPPKSNRLASEDIYGASGLPKRDLYSRTKLGSIDSRGEDQQYGDSSSFRDSSAYGGSTSRGKFSRGEPEESVEMSRMSRKPLALAYEPLDGDDSKRTSRYGGKNVPDSDSEYYGDGNRRQLGRSYDEEENDTRNNDDDDDYYSSKSSKSLRKQEPELSNDDEQYNSRSYLKNKDKRSSREYEDEEVDDYDDRSGKKDKKKSRASEDYDSKKSKRGYDDDQEEEDSRYSSRSKKYGRETSNREEDDDYYGGDKRKDKKKRDRDSRSSRNDDYDEDNERSRYSDEEDADRRHRRNNNDDDDDYGSSEKSKKKKDKEKKSKRDRDKDDYDYDNNYDEEDDRQSRRKSRSYDDEEAEEEDRDSRRSRKSKKRSSKYD